MHAETQKIAQDSSSAMADGWLRTYEMNARKRQRDAIRWERWEATNGRAKLFPHVGASPGRLVMSGASSPASSRRSSPIRRFQSPMSERRTSPARSESSTMGKNKNRGPQNKAQNGTSATGANAVPTASAPMSRAAFNYQTQPALPWNIAARNPAQHSAFAVPISSFCRPTPTLTNSLTCPADAAVPQTIQELSAVPIQPLPSVQPPAAAAPLTQLPSSIHTSQPFADVVPTSSAKDAKVAERSERRQSSIHPEETIKVGSDGPPKSRYRPRSRSPPGDRVRLYRERDYSGDNRVSRQYDYPVQPPAVRYAPRVLYDEYGYEYVCTGRRPTPYVLYELPPPRGY
ncbi:hypothetical protein BLS_002843 [Venturia inaequalis]|uniref:Uncharacterized protein n=1 Tax=Venturia inaequalis TaxID=5025 RepID=A0A8H3UQP1_VENIN|nr:hypothetical protein BLS_002843 [Venturia inaequalis]KAE9974978.1 hypothetical protein EG328_003515 [Venturia inaequalis]